MNYIKQLNAWHKRRRTKGISVPAQSMYSILLDIVNRAAKGKQWREWTPISLAQLADELPGSRPTIIKLKRELVEKGFVEVEKSKTSSNGNDCDLWRIVPLYDEQPQATADTAAQEAADEEQARQIMARHPDGEDVKERMMAIGFHALETAQMIDEGGVRLCAEIMDEVDHTEIKKSKKGLYITKYNDRASALIRSRQAAARNQAEAQERQEQQDANYTPPDVDAVMSDIA